MDTVEYIEQLRRGIETSNGLLIDLGVDNWLADSGISTRERCNKRTSSGTLFTTAQRDTSQGVG